MKQYFQAKGLTIPFKSVTCVQVGKGSQNGQINVHLMINTISLYEEDADNFLKEYHNWLNWYDV